MALFTYKKKSIESKLNKLSLMSYVLVTTMCLYVFLHQLFWKQVLKKLDINQIVCIAILCTKNTGGVWHA